MSTEVEAGESEGDWPDAAVDYVQAIADTKLLLGHRYGERMASGQSIEDDTANMNLAQEEFGHVRQLYERLEEQGRSRQWLEHERDPGEFANASLLDEPVPDWTEFIVRMSLLDRAAWLLLDAIDHEDVTGIVRKIAEEEYFHLERGDGWLEQLAEEKPEALEAALATALPETLAFVGPATYDGETDPVYQSGFTDTPVAELREALIEHYENLFADTPVSLEDVDLDAPDPDAWDETRRREGEGTIAEDTAATIRGEKNREFAVT